MHRRNRRVLAWGRSGPRSLCTPISKMRVKTPTLLTSWSSSVDEMRLSHSLDRWSLHLMGNAESKWGGVE